MKVIAYDKFKPGTTMEMVNPHLPEETATVWKLWKQGIVRENYATADAPGVVIVFEVASIDEAKKHIDSLPLTKAGLIEWFYIALTAPLPIESMFNDESVKRVAIPDSEYEGASASSATAAK